MFTPRSMIKMAEEYLECKFYLFCHFTLLIYFISHHSDKQSFKLSATRKRTAVENIPNIVKRRRVPRAIQPSVAQAFKDFRPRYRRRQCVIVPPASSKSAENENEPQVTRSFIRLRGHN